MKKPKLSRPLDVRVGAVPATHFTPENHVMVADPPLVKSNTKALTFPEEAVLETVNVVAPDTVCVK